MYQTRARKIGNWYQVTELRPNVFQVEEPEHVSFFVLRYSESHAVFIDSGLGLSERLAVQLLKRLGITKFSVINTHAHCDHVGLNYLAEKVWISKRE